MTLMRIFRNLVVVAGAPAVGLGQTDEDLARLKEAVVVQEREISEQEKALVALRGVVEEQRRLLKDTLGIGAAPKEAPQTTADAQRPRAMNVIANEPNAFTLNASQEVRFSKSSPTLKLGPADIRLEGYI